ncbi:MAG TPA: type IV toxin-antitoxin system AbiEi family antitoxin [Chloroflexota bacterium]|nr:type IV toxin-antitoxin system AbiEi family antitoxin [Chloroflexota bacterium]
MPKGKQLLVVEVKGTGQPRLAREAINQLLRYIQLKPNAYGIFVAPYISPESAEICRQEGVGYLDLAGNCYLAFGQVFIRRECRPNPFVQRRDLRTLYSPKAERVLRVLLQRPNRAWKTEALANEARVSLGQVANVKRLLADREWIQVGVDGFRLSKPERVLAEWTGNYGLRRNQTVDFYTAKEISEVEYELAGVGTSDETRSVLTGFSGAARFAPFVRYSRVTAYVPDSVDRIASRLGLKQVPSGSNVNLVVPYDEGVFYGAEDVRGTRVASPIQLYLDLRTMKGRSEEAANALLEEVIKPRWQQAE